MLTVEHVHLETPLTWTIEEARLRLGIGQAALDELISEGKIQLLTIGPQERITEQVQTYDLNRVIVASCSPRTHEPLFRESLQEAGLNRYLFEMANIRDQCSWVHMHEPDAATEKAKDLVRMAVAKARGLAPLPRYPQPVIPRGLVIGGGLA